MDYELRTDSRTKERTLEVPYRGRDLISRPVLNKGTAFTEAEREEFGLTGLLPPGVSTMDLQLERAYGNFKRQPTDLDRYIYLGTLQDRNETLFFRLLLTHLAEMVPIVYTPVVAEGCRHYSRIYRQGRGLYVSIRDKGRVGQVLRNFGATPPDIIVVTDNERILGIGDQGVGGMGIPVGKLTLYVVTAGFHPGKCLPISLDVGTNNKALLEDPLYLGIREPRLRGEPYHAFVREFVDAVREVFPGTLLQWEDFGKTTAMVHLDTYKEKLPTFNDDIQGTAAVVHAGLVAAADMIGVPFKGFRVGIDGAGSAGIGIARQIEAGMVRAGVPKAEAHSRIYLLDSKGIVFSDRQSVEPEKREYVSAPDRFPRLKRDGKGEIHLQEFVEGTPLDVLLGVSGTPGVFTEPIVKAMGRHAKRPIIMPLSNPTSQCEAKPEDIVRWTDGRAVVATGSPFPDVSYGGKTIPVGQGNNMFIFPGVGLGTVLVKARIVTNKMFLASADAMRACLPNDRLSAGAVFPEIREARKVAAEVAYRVGEAAHAEGVAAKDAPKGEALKKLIAESMWFPDYVRYRYAAEGKKTSARMAAPAKARK